MARNTMNISLANDLGYGFAKMCFDGKDRYKLPSTKASKRPASSGQNGSNFINRANLDRYIENYMNHLDTTISSSGLDHDNQQENLVGQAAVSSNRHLQSFNVSDSSGKSSTDLSLVITLSAIAGYALSKYFKANKKIPSSLRVNVAMATALPIVEGDRPGVKDEYKQRYLSAPHIVKINNVGKPVVVHIKFTDVYILLEGQAAEFAIWCSKPDNGARKALVPGLRDSISRYYDMYDRDVMGGGNMDPNLLVSPKRNVLGIDIGEGTTDYAVFHGSEVITAASRSMNTGYGNLLNEALVELQQNNFGVSDRGHLKRLIDEPANPLNQRKKDRIKQALSHHVGGFIDDVVANMSMSMRIAQNGIELIYVYGGGSIPLAHILRKPLMDEAKKFNSGDAIPVIFIDKRWAQSMNELGLQLLLDYEHK